MAWYNDVFGSGANIFGASSNINTDKYTKLGLLDPNDVKKAQRASLTKGLLGSALGYLAQPQNQNYGSIVPYIAKGLGAGVKMAQQPYDNLTNKVEENQAIKNYEEALKVKQAKQEFKEGWGQNNDSVTRKYLAPTGLNSNYKPIQDNLMLSPYTKGDSTSQVAPNLGNDDELMTEMTKEINYFNKNKHLETALRNGAIEFEDYLKYTAEPEGYELADGAQRYDGNNRLVASNEKDFAPSANGAPIDPRTADEKKIAELSIDSSFEQLEAMDRTYSDYQMLGSTYQKLQDPDFGYFEGKLSKLKEEVVGVALGLGWDDVATMIHPDNPDYLKNTELLNAQMQAGVFRAIADLGIGARGIDKHAEREFLIQVLTGNASSQRATLMALVEERYKATEREVSDFNEAEATGFYDRFLGKTPRYRKKNQYPTIELSNL